MPDRVDPMGQWFDLGGAKPGALPSLEDAQANSSVAQPKATQSLAMQPRQPNVITRVIPGNAFHVAGPAPTTYYSNSTPPLSSLSAAAGHVFIAVYPVLDLLPGTQLISLGGMVRVFDANSSFTFAAIEFSTTNPDTILHSLGEGPSPPLGVWTPFSFSVGSFPIEANSALYVEAEFSVGATAGDDALQLGWMSYTAQLPG